MNNFRELMDDIQLDAGNLSCLMDTILEMAIQIPGVRDRAPDIDARRVAALVSVATDLSHKIDRRIEEISQECL